MRRLDPLDSKNAFSRTAEQFWRGFASAVICAIILLLSFLSFYAADFVISYTPVSSGTRTIVAFAIALFVGIWMLGDRTVLRTFGQMAKISNQ